MEWQDKAIEKYLTEMVNLILGEIGDHRELILICNVDDGTTGVRFWH